jgi:hypothetical protein
VGFEEKGCVISCLSPARFVPESEFKKVHQLEWGGAGFGAVGGLRHCLE